MCFTPRGRKRLWKKILWTGVLKVCEFRKRCYCIALLFAFFIVVWGFFGGFWWFFLFLFSLNKILNPCNIECCPSSGNIHISPEFFLVWDFKKSLYSLVVQCRTETETIPAHQTGYWICSNKCRNLTMTFEFFFFGDKLKSCFPFMQKAILKAFSMDLEQVLWAKAL